MISLAPNLFYGTSIAVNILVLSKHKTDNKTQFIDASGIDFYKKGINNNVLTDEHIEKIISMFDSKEEVEHTAKSIDYDEIVQKEYNLSVSSYIVAKDTSEVVDIDELNEVIKKTVAKIDQLRAEIDKVVEEIES